MVKNPGVRFKIISKGFPAFVICNDHGTAAVSGAGEKRGLGAGRGMYCPVSPCILHSRRPQAMERMVTPGSSKWPKSAEARDLGLIAERNSPTGSTGKERLY